MSEASGHPAETVVAQTELRFELHTLARACGVEAPYVRTLVDEELLRPLATEPEWRFGGDALARVRRIRRLQRDFDASLASVAVMLDLLDEIERLCGVLRRSGLEP